jgi:hypothetical protein
MIQIDSFKVANALGEKSRESTIYNPSTQLNHTANLLTVLANGSGDELFTKSDLRAIGAHPFSESTRRRKIKSGHYPPPIMLSEQMGLWKLKSIRFFLIDPTTYKVRVSQLRDEIKKS